MRSVRRRSLLGLIAIASIGVVAACGGGDDDSSSSEDFAEEANAICADSNEQLEEIGVPTIDADTEESDANAQIEDFVDEVLPVLAEQRASLEGVTPPEDVEADYERALDLLSEREQLLEQIRDAIDDGEPPIVASLDVAERLEEIATELDELADELGLDECGEPVGASSADDPASEDTSTGEDPTGSPDDDTLGEEPATEESTEESTGDAPLGPAEREIAATLRINPEDCRGSEAEPSAIAEITCRTGRVIAVYEQYPGAAAMSRVYNAVRTAEGIDRDVGSCPRAVPSERGWTFNGDPAGRFLCFVSDAGSPVMAWTYADTAILADATTDTNLRALHRWWIDRAPNPPG